LPTAADKAAELEAALTAELTEGQGAFLYKMLGERLEQILARKDADMQAAQRKLQELEALVRDSHCPAFEQHRRWLKDNQTTLTGRRAYATP